MDLKSYWGNIRLVMGYSDIVVRVYVDVLGPLYVLLGPVVDGIHLYQVRDVHAEGMP